MPRLTDKLPKYRKHRASGQAVVTIAGRDVYLGPHGTKASKVEYDRVIAEWLAAGRPSTPQPSASDITLAEVMAAYRSCHDFTYLSCQQSHQLDRLLIRAGFDEIGRAALMDRFTGTNRLKSFL